MIKNVVNLKEKFPDYFRKIQFNAVIDPKNDFYAIDKFFLNNEVIKDISMTSTIISDNYSKSEIKMNKDFYSKSEYELFRIFYYLLRKKSIKNCSRIMKGYYDNIANFSKQLKPQKMLSEKTHHSGPCIPGVKKLFMDTDGFFYPCEKVSESSDLMKIGHIDIGLDINKVRKLLNIGQVNDTACKNCWGIKFCSICAAILDNTEDEFSVKRKEECCEMVNAATEEKLKNYCFLKEFGHDFDEKELEENI